MSTSRIGGQNPNIQAGLNAAATAPSRPEEGKAREANAIGPAGAAAAALGDSDSAAPANTNNVAAGGKDYGVQISDSAKRRAEAHKKALNIARGTPDIREDRVASLKKQIDEGTYQIDSGKIADGMLREAIKDHLAESDH